MLVHVMGIPAEKKAKKKNAAALVIRLQFDVFFPSSADRRARNMLTPVYFSRSDSAFCKLPTTFAKKYGHLANSNQGTRSSSLVVIQLRWSTQRDPVYVCWLGEISQVSDDVIELPATQFETFSSLDVVTIEDAYAHVEEAIEVYFKPLSSFDWEIISSHAATVEQNLLRQISIAYVNQIIRVKVTRNLSVQLSCQSIKTNKRCVSSTDTTSSAFDRVVRMSGQTLAMIEPLTAKPIHTSNTPIASSSASSSSLLASSSHHQSTHIDDNNNNNNNNNSTRIFHTLLTQTDSGNDLTLRVLPQRFRVVNTGYQHTPPHHHSMNDDVDDGYYEMKGSNLNSDSLSLPPMDNNNDIDCFSDCIDMYKGEDEEDDDDDENDDVAMMELHGEGDERPYEGLGYDDLTCFVHPSSCLTMTPSHSHPHPHPHLHASRSWWLAEIHTLDTSTTSTSTKSPSSSSSSSSSSVPISEPLHTHPATSSITSSLVHTLVVRIQTSATVRPSHISLPLRLPPTPPHPLS